MRPVLLAIAVAALIGASLASPDPCAVHPNCQECVNDHPHVCGWCSTPVVYKDGGVKGNHCGTLDGTHPYACYGVFSTEDCIRGYKCNTNEGICEQTDPGEGLPFEVCTKNCTAKVSPSPVPPPSASPPKPADTFECNTTNWKCIKTVPGRGTSKELCDAGCHKANPSAVSPVSPQPAAPTYECNTTNYECFRTEPGHGASKEVCIAQCVKHPSPVPPPPAESYLCNETSSQCVKTESKNGTSLAQCKQICLELYYCDQSQANNPVCMPAPFPRPGVPLPDCVESCKPHNVTPSDLLGTWRGLQIGEGYLSGEWDVDFKEAHVVITFQGKRIAGTVSYTGTAPYIILTVGITESSFPGFSAGEKLSFIYDFDGAAPEVRYLSLASGKPNQPAPKDFEEAKKSGFFDWVLWECQPLTGCKFQENKEVVAASKAKIPAVAPTVDDPCSVEPTCTQCLAHKFCGWCSVDVVYKDGSPGKHCAGFNSNTSRNQFECHGVFRTDDCNDYLCVEPQGECVAVPLGGGKSKTECEKDCHPGPKPSPPPHTSPTPPPPEPSPALTYECNATNYRCFKTRPGHGSSLEVCESACKKAPTPSPVSPQPNSPPPPAPTFLCNATAYKCEHATPGHGASLEVCLQLCKRPPSPPPGPTPVTGRLRGLQIDNLYHKGEFDMDVDANGAYKLTLDGAFVQSGTLYFGSELGSVVLTVTSGTGAGKSVSGYFTQSKGRDVTHTLIAFGKDEKDVPTGWDEPWIKGGANGNEWVWIQSNSK